MDNRSLLRHRRRVGKTICATRQSFDFVCTKEKELERVKALCSNPQNISIVPLDLTKFEELPKKVDEALGCFGSIDLLINNGGVSQRSLIAETDFNVYKQLMDINYLGTVALSKALLPHFLKQKKGHYAVITSVMGKYASPYRSGYAGAKHALHGFFDALRMEHHNDNIHVSLLCRFCSNQCDYQCINRRWFNTGSRRSCH